MAVFLENHVFFTKGKTLYSLNTETSETKKHRAHTDLITCMRACPPKLYTGGRDCKICIWSSSDCLELEVSAAVKLLAVSTKWLYFVRGAPQQINVIDLESRSLSSKSYMRDKISDIVALEISVDSSRLLVLTSYKLSILNLASEVSTDFSHKVPMTCMAYGEDYIACGDVAGQIIKFYTSTQSKVHWHSHAVSALKRTLGFLLSAGEEGVVVMWQDFSGLPDFLPRLGSPIEALDANPDGSFYLVKLKDSSVLVLRSDDYRTVAQFSGLTDPSSIIPTSKVWTVSKLMDSIVLNGAPGFIQTLDLQTQQVTKFDCATRNPVSRSDSEFPHPLEVTQVAFCDQFMGTVETALNAPIPLHYLKFWKDMQVNSLIMHPHNDSIFRLVSHSYFVSAGKEDVNVWEWNETRFYIRGVLTYANLEVKDVCINKYGIFVAFEHMIVKYKHDLSIATKLYEPESQAFAEIKYTEKSLIARTLEKVHVYKKGLIQWSLSLAYMQGIYAEGSCFIVALNASKYAPIEERLKKANILVKFDVSSHRPLKVYKVNNVKVWCLVDNQTLILDEFFDCQNLDREDDEKHDEITLEVKERHIDEKAAEEVPAVKYISSKPLYEAETLKSNELPSTELYFNWVVLSELNSLN